MKVFVTGVNGQLGHDVVNELSSRKIDVIGSDITPSYSGILDGTPIESAQYLQLDITNPDDVYITLSKASPDVVIHCAAWTAVDLAEDANCIEKVHLVNSTGTENIAKACAKINSSILYLSTDYVFDGSGDLPWKPEDDNFNPLSVYGASKLAGEKAILKFCTKYFIVRISWVFGINGKNFVKTMLNLAKNHECVKVVNDQIGTPTYTYDLASLLADMILTDKYGIYHATNEGGYISWAEFANAIFDLDAELSGINTPRCKVLPVTTEEYGLSKAKRPQNSRMDKSKLERNGFSLLPHWRDALTRYMNTLHEIDRKIPSNTQA